MRSSYLIFNFFAAAFFLFAPTTGSGQASVELNFDFEKFRAADPDERRRVLLDFDFEKLDSAALATIFSEIEKTVADDGDARLQFAVDYQKFICRRILKMPDAAVLAHLADLQNFTEKKRLRVEQTVVQIYRAFEERGQQKTPFEQTYVTLLACAADMESAGFEAFRDYRTDYLLRYIGRFFYDLEDYERALGYLQTAEQFMQQRTDRARNCLLILNNIQTIFQKQKNYEQGIAYAQKILDFTQKLPDAPSEPAELKHLWAGIATVDIAAMLVEQQRFSEGEVLADRGYQMILGQSAWGASQAEYDVLQVLIPIKLGLKKLDEAQKLLRRTDDLNRILDRDPKTSPFKHIRFYQSYGKYHELSGNFGEALRYFNLSKSLSDSLEHQNDARKLEKLRQRQEAEKYAAQLRLVEGERRFQTLLRNAALLVLALVAVLAFVNLRRLQAKRRLALADLGAARSELEIFTKNFKEKSDLAENLRLEIEQLSNRGERSQYLEQLTHSTILTDDDWSRFRAVFEKVHPDFIAGQRAAFPDLTQAELRYLVLEKLGLTTHEMANMLGVSDGTIRQTRSRLRKKTGGKLEE